MSAPTFYKQVIPPAIKSLGNLSAILKKAEAFADEKGTPHEEILNFRLHPDMRGLAYQVQSCSNTIKFIPSRFKVAEDIFFPDDETTFEQLQQRITTTVEYLNKLEPEKWAGKESEPMVMPTKSMGSFQFESGQAYVSNYALPNFHFHLTTAYCILRHLGVPLSAFDYLGKDTFVKVAE